jgi:O-antigen/teichoic acid export membrane protein
MQHGNTTTLDERTPPPFRMARVGRQTVIYGAGVLLSRAFSFLMLPLFTYYLTPADYGVIQLIEMTFDVISIVAGSRLALGIFRFYYKAETPAARHGVISTALLLLAAIYGVVAVIAFAGSEAVSQLVFQTSEYRHVIRIAACSFAFQALVETPLAYFRLVERPVTYVKVTVGKLALQAALSFLFLAYYGLGITGVFLSSLIAHVLTGAGLAIHVLRSTGLRFSASHARDLLRFGFPLVLTQVATFAATYGDRYFLQAAAGTTIVGLYALAYNFGFLLYQIGHTPFALVWEPMRYEIARRQDRDQLYARGFIYLNVLLLTSAAGLALFVGDFLRIFAQPAYYPAAQVVPVILVAYVLQSWTMVQDIGIMIREKTKYNTFANWTAAIVALVGYAVLIPRYLEWGAALATVAAFAVRFGIIYRISQRLWPVHYRWGPVLRLSLLAAAVIVAGTLLPALPLGTSIAARSALLLVYLFGLWHLNVISAEDRSRLRALASPRAIWSHVSGAMGGAAGGKP